ncbi:putative syntaxin binding protein [Trypanosoma cruzi]|uniref:Putative syntaxin binding protein n=1 Tax=Trypanosoma cruzi TaxID=5693 RepID=A0A7J6XI67_TRYCR|nr:putative syntaxin binding protein [Trypanosoma cruzi]
MLIETANRNRTLQVGLSLASVQRDHAMRPNGASGGQNSGEAGKTPGHFKGVVANGRIILIWVAVVGRLPSQLLSALCCLFWVVWSAARGARSMRYPKDMAVRWSLGKPRCRVLRCVCPGNWHPTAVGLTARHAQERIEGQRVEIHKHTRLRVSMGIVCASSCIPFLSKKCSIRCACVCFNDRAACILPLYSRVCGCKSFPCN